MTCVVCRRAVLTRPYRLASGATLGEVCGEECGVVAWEAHFDRVSDAPLHARQSTAWRWRRRVAEANGSLFTEPAPKSPAERELERVIAERDLEVVARELA